VLQLRVFGGSEVIAEVAKHLQELDGSAHVIFTPDGISGQALVTADLAPEAVDSTLEKMQSLGVPAKDVILFELETIGHSTAQRPLATVIWSDLLSQAGANARPLARYLIFMAAAGIIAAFGVIYTNTTLIVGAMAISPDLLPITAAATALVLRRWSLVGRSVGALIIGLGCACAVGAVMTAVLHGTGLIPIHLRPNHTGFLDGLATVNIATPIVALAAGIVAILGLETRASTAVGVAISVTTIPASAVLGVAAGLGRLDQAAGALTVLGINVAMILVGSTVTLLTQRALARRRSRRASGPVPIES